MWTIHKKRRNSNFKRNSASIDPYELIPIGKGIGIVLKGTKKLIAVYKDVKTVEKAVEKYGVKIEHINNLRYPTTNSKVLVQLKTELTFKDAGVLDRNEKLNQKAINNSNKIELSDEVIRNFQLYLN